MDTDTQHGATVSRSRMRAGFSLVELLVIITILGVIATAVIFTLGDAVSGAERTIMARDVKEIEKLIETRRLNGDTPVEIAEIIRESEGSVVVKVLGSMQHLKDIAVGGSSCAAGGSVFNYLKTINGNSSAGILASTGTARVRSAHFTDGAGPHIVCISRGLNANDKEFSVSVEVIEGVWGCGTNSGGYMAVNFFSVHDTPGQHSIYSDCSVNASDGTFRSVAGDFFTGFAEGYEL